MERSLYTAASGMQAQQLNIDIISNNLANVNTTGYKKSSAHFTTLFSQVLSAPGAQQSDGRISPNGVQVGLGVELQSTDKSFAMGSLQHTQDKLDIAIEGDGFIQVQMPDGTIGYTRDGQLKLDGQTGELLSSQGYSLYPNVILGDDVNDVSIMADGTVQVSRSSDYANLDEVGNISIAKFINPAGLVEVSGNIFKESVASGAPVEGIPGSDGYGTVKQYFLEQSNVKVVEEIVNMVAAQRAYEAGSNSIKAADEMLRQANQLAS